MGYAPSRAALVNSAQPLGLDLNLPLFDGLLIRVELVERDVHIDGKRIARLIRRASKRRGYTNTRQREPRLRPPVDLVNRCFRADDPNQLSMVDMIYIPTWAELVYLAVVLDVWRARVVGWSIGERMESDVVLVALNMVLEQHKPDAMIHHSDQGKPIHQRDLRLALCANFERLNQAMATSIPA